MDARRLIAAAAFACLLFAVGCVGEVDSGSGSGSSSSARSISVSMSVADRPASSEASSYASSSTSVSSEASSAPSSSSAEPAPPADLDITQRYYADLQHGEKPAQYQKYIVLHDTEGGGTADGVLEYWEGNGNKIASHFIVNKDGSILQCVPLDKIAHHAGWGSNGHNVQFGVEDESRDDLLGRKPSSSYTDYGMNSFSVGIEMVHQGSDSYPEAQLQALDKLIAYIDAYYGGNAGTIIDHKMWRLGNSDTSSAFAAYLANYRDHRTHD